MPSQRTEIPVATVNPPADQLVRLPGPLLVLGPAYSGKSEFATALVDPSKNTSVLGTLSTTTQQEAPGLALRIQQLQASRPAHWQQVSADTGLAEKLGAVITPQVIVDSVNLWVGNLIVIGSQTYNAEDLSAHIWAELNELTRQLARLPKVERLILVSSESGAGLPPETGNARLFRQALGRLNQLLAAHCQTVILMNAGIPTVLKPQRTLGAECAG